MTMTAPNSRHAGAQIVDRRPLDTPRVSLVDRTLMQVGLALLLLGERRAAAPRPAGRARIDTAGRPTAEIFRQFC
ncbi:hypothetical protein QDR37_00995 [Amnibacterium sp. CER49]|uniref:hypothetical protein n=1 Tax=Amnibacterium sp. CER49 TaxID=3039161 RepID=UPI002449AB4D|nr:hypothetical protein [Amnibacterium sp. CER49]MDH2442512.1 hypothetical protein [Amnibacterium sp. CER49]